ncbi:MAG TPA: efflux RND transporter periplasmic adaptor subunit, partial [Ignavibacteriales bacterium]|nr:efflux RND transporter periplasmic adaptor subunit [Ignavibacteriales bacterium]
FGAALFQGCSNLAEEGSNNNKAVNVKTTQVKEIGSAQEMAYSGTIEESETTPLSFSVIGSVSRVLVSEGDYVKKGQLLAMLNSENYESAYKIAAASEKQAEDAYNRLLPMFKNGNLPEIKIVERETDLQKAKSQAAIAKKNLEDCNLYSPVTGYVGKRLVEPGMSAMPNIASIEIVQITKVFAITPVPESEIASIKKGQKANIKVGALNGSEFAGIVEETGVMADPLAHTYKIKIGITNKDGELRPGMVCNVTLEKLNTEAGLVVPGNSLMVDEQNRNYVFTIDPSGKKAVKKYVKTGRLLNAGIEILEGLTLNDVVIVSGQHKLVDGSFVQVQNN